MPDSSNNVNTSTDATPLASEQITKPDWFDDISFLRGEINALFARTKGHSLRAKEWHDRGCAILDRIAALSATPAPGGWKLVPIDCTDEIAEAIAPLARCCGGIAETIWRAALDAAPSDQDASQAQGEVERVREAIAEAFCAGAKFARRNPDANPHTPAMGMAAKFTPAPGATAQDGVEDCDRCAGRGVGGDGRECQHCGGRGDLSTPTIPAGMVAWNGGDSAPKDWDGGGVKLRNGSSMFPSKVSLAYHPHGTDRWNHERPCRNPDWDIVAYTAKDSGQGVSGEVAPSRHDPRGIQCAACHKWVETTSAGYCFACIKGFKVPDAAAPKQAEQQGVERVLRFLSLAWANVPLSVRRSADGEYQSVTAILAALNAPTGAVEKGEAK